MLPLANLKEASMSKFAQSIFANGKAAICRECDVQTFEVKCEKAAEVAQEAGFSNFAQALRELGQGVSSEQRNHR